MRLTPKAQWALLLAKEEAQTFRHDFVGTQHLLLGLLAAQGSVAQIVLTNLGVDLVQARCQVLEICSYGGEMRGKSLTLKWDRVLQLASRIAQVQGETRISTQHLLISLATTEGVGGQMLASWSITPDMLHAELAKRTDLYLEESVPKWVYLRGGSPVI